MTDRDLLELIACQVGILTTQVDGFTMRMDGLTMRMDGLTKDMAEVKAIVVKIENDHGQKLGALLDGYKQNSERLDKVEEKLAEHEIILLHGR